jgi:PAS domain S-box-containing protein
VIFNRKNIYYIICVLIFLTPFNLIAQNYDAESVNYSVENGLSNNTVNCILQDSKGYLWIGTNNGLNKFDGYKFTNYHSIPQDSSTLSNDIITSLAEDSNGILWIATKDGGINKFDHSSEHFLSYKKKPADENSINENSINSICSDEFGNIWIGTNNEGLNKHEKNNQNFISYRHDKSNPNSLCSNSIKNIIYLGNSRLLIGTIDGLCLFDFKNNIFKNYKHSEKDNNSLHNNNVCSIFEDLYKQIWVASSNLGFQRFDVATGKFTTYDIPLSIIQSSKPDFVNCITDDKSGKLLLSFSSGNEILRFNERNNSFDFIKSNFLGVDTYSERKINFIFLDRTNVLWSGTKIFGLDKINLNKNKFNFYNIGYDSPQLGISRQIWSVYCDTDNNIWLGTIDGLKLFNRINGTSKTFSDIPGNFSTVKEKNVSSVIRDKEDFLWVGTWGGGLNKFDIQKGRFTNFTCTGKNDNCISSNFIRTLYEDREGLLWIGTGDAGITTYNKKKNEFSTFLIEINDTNSLRINDISQIYEDKYGEMWIGTWAGGIIKYNKATGEFTRFRYDANNSGSIISDLVLSICEDQKGDLWIGTSNGLEKYNRNSNNFSHFLIIDGLPDETINSILADDKDNLWLATNYGLSRFNTKSLTFRNFYSYDGLQNKEFNQSCCKSKDGEFFFCGSNGFDSFYPDSVTDRENNSTVAITSFKILNESTNSIRDISDLNEINLSYKDNSFTIEFSLLDYVNPYHNQYSYQMYGFEKDWVNSKNTRSVKYSNLDPGEYTFLVKAANDDKVWTKPISLKIIITPSFWKSRWFYLLLSSIIIFTIIIVTREFLKYNKRDKILKIDINQRNSELEKTNLNLQKEFMERQRIEESLRNSEMEYRLLVENANEAIIVMQEDKIIFTNSKTNEIIDVPLQGLSTESIFNYIHPEDKEKIIDIYERRKQNEYAPDHYSTRVMRKDTKLMYIDIKRVNVQWKGKPATLFFINDITDRKRAEDEVKKALEKEKELSELRSRFISMTSHEFRTPLTSIYTSSELLDKYNDELSDVQRRKSLLRIQKNVQQMTRLLNEVLILGRSDSGMLKLKLEPVDINQLCAELIEEFHSYIIYQTKQKLVLDIQESTGRVLLDYSLIKQSLENLISNAVKYSGAESKVTFKVNFSSRFITFRIKDEGIGIPPEDIDNLFEPFFRAGNIGNISGSGLGLAIVKRGVELHEGKIKVVSKVGEGSEFIVTVPLIKVV